VICNLEESSSGRPDGSGRLRRRLHQRFDAVIATAGTPALNEGLPVGNDRMGGLIMGVCQFLGM